MKIEELGKIKYGNLRFEFSATQNILNYFEEKGVSSQALLITSQAFYKAVCYKLDLDHNEEKEVEVVISGVNLDENGVNDFVSGYMQFESFPLHLDDQVFFVNFGARVK